MGSWGEGRRWGEGDMFWGQQVQPQHTNAFPLSTCQGMEELEVEFLLEER